MEQIAILKESWGYSDGYGNFIGRAAADTPVTIVREGRHAQEVVIRFADGRECLAQRRCLQVVI